MLRFYRDEDHGLTGERCQIAVFSASGKALLINLSVLENFKISIRSLELHCFWGK